AGRVRTPGARHHPLGRPRRPRTSPTIPRPMNIFTTSSKGYPARRRPTGQMFQRLTSELPPDDAPAPPMKGPRTLRSAINTPCRPAPPTPPAEKRLRRLVNLCCSRKPPSALAWHGCCLTPPRQDPVDGFPKVLLAAGHLPRRRAAPGRCAPISTSSARQGAPSSEEERFHVSERGCHLPDGEEGTDGGAQRGRRRREG